MSRGVGAGNLIQAALWGAAVAWLAPRWAPAAVLAGLCAVLQVVAGLALLTGRRPELARRASALTLAGGAALFALLGQGVFVIATRFGAEAKDIGLATLGGAAAALPWLVGFPLWQVLSGRGGRAGAAGMALLAGGLAWSAGALASRPEQTWAAQPQQVEAARAAYARWTGADQATLPAGGAAATVLLTPWTDGRPGKSARGDGADLAEAVAQALSRVAAPAGERPALVLDVARARYEAGALLGPDSGGLSEGGGRSPSLLWRPAGVTRVSPLPLARVPSVNPAGDPTVFDSVLADATGARALDDGFPAPPPLDAAVALEAALEGGRMLARNQGEDGRYAYVVSGPSGEQGGGYNFPRHAGVTWFLARLNARAPDPGVAAALSRGLDYLVSTTVTLPDGRAYVRDPTRKDQKVWVGTTALAVLAAVAAGHPAAPGWGRFVADSVDAEGQVRGDMDLGTLAFPPQSRNPYGQGQVLLALAALVRGGHDAFAEPLQRAMRYVDGAYAPGAAGRLVVLDEHWACLAALAARDATGTPAGWDLCRSYVAQAAFDTPTPGSSVHLSTGAAGGLAEAVVAAAVLDPGGPWRARALAFADLFVRKAFRAADAPLLERPMALLGGFRDATGDWDVRMDAVQHIGCALLGAEALLDAPRAGSLP